jgi:hypothetical protein
MKRSVTLDQQLKTGIEFKASLITKSGGDLQEAQANRNQQKP